MTEENVRKILDIKKGDTSDQIKAKFGLFRIKAFQEGNYSEAQQEEIRHIILEMTDPETNEERLSRLELEKLLEKNN